MTERKVNAGVAVVLINMHHEVLMGKRKGSHGAGTWSFPGGWMRHGESFLDTASREVKEETGIDLLNTEPEIIHSSTTLFKEADVQSVTVLLLARTWKGIASVLEPDKIEGKLEWFRVNSLPQPLFLPLTQFDLSQKLLSFT